MNEVKIEEIANELGIKSRELIFRIGQLSEEALFSLNIKSGSSIINVKIAEEIFDAIMGNRELTGVVPPPIYRSIGNINFSFVKSSIDIAFIKSIASIYKTQSAEHFMVRSFNFSEMDIVRFFTAGLIGMDVVRYINNRSDKSELDRLINNLNKILNDVEVEDIDNQDPLYNLESYIDKHKPEVVYIEGIDAKDADKYKDVFQYIRDLSAASEIRFNIGFVNLPDDKNNKTVDRIVSFFRKH
jgi:hypothetical protein